MQIDAATIEDIADETRIEADDIRWNYRYNDIGACIGIVASISQAAKFTRLLGEALADRHGPEAAETADKVRSDDMGRDTIYYWPALTVEG